MQLKEVMQITGLSARAIKYYEEQKLLVVSKDVNGYRNYTQEDIQILRRISVYRKLGISIVDIRALLKDEKKEILQKILDEKQKEHTIQSRQIEALRHMIETGEVQQVEKMIDYDTIAQAISDGVPGFYGRYLLHHFMPFLQGRIETKQQEEAFQRIIAFWDHTRIHIPFVLRLLYRLLPEQSMDTMIVSTQQTIKKYMDMSEEDYEKLKEETIHQVTIRNSFFFRFNPVSAAQRKLMKQFQDCGYNDVFLENLKILSPSYCIYSQAMDRINARLNADIGLYYDSDFHIMIGK